MRHCDWPLFSVRKALHRVGSTSHGWPAEDASSLTTWNTWQTQQDVTDQLKMPAHWPPEIHDKHYSKMWLTSWRCQLTDHLKHITITTAWHGWPAEMPAHWPPEYMTIKTRTLTGWRCQLTDHLKKMTNTTARRDWPADDASSLTTWNKWQTLQQDVTDRLRCQLTGHLIYMTNITARRDWPAEDANWLTTWNTE